MTKLCKDCKYYRRNWVEHIFMKNDYWDFCMRPNNLNVVSQMPNGYRCAYEREYEYLCGPGGKYFEKRK